MTPWTKIGIGVLVVAGAMTVCAARPHVDGARVAPEPQDGASLYYAHCASCHGTSGRGDGAVAAYLRIPPADLTRIAARHGGTFPAERLRRIIDGRQLIRAHGRTDMPVWGPIFARSPIVEDHAALDAALTALVAHLESLQERPGE